MSLPEPFYVDDAVTIYHGDCRELLSEMKQAELGLTDPPWPLSRELMVGSLDAHALWASVAPHLRVRRLLIWLPTHADPRPYLTPLEAWPYLRLLYVRRALPSYYGRVLMDGEVIHALGEWPAARKGRMVIPGGMEVTSRANEREQGAPHPGRRNLRVARWLVHWWSDPGDLVLDPFAGSGTTLRAAKDLGRRAIGIEIEERWCELAVRRLAQEVLVS